MSKFKKSGVKHCKNCMYFDDCRKRDSSINENTKISCLTFVSK